MASLETRRWEGDLAGLTRRDRRPGNYEIYLPDPLAGRNFSLDGDVTAADLNGKDGSNVPAACLPRCRICHCHSILRAGA